MDFILKKMSAIFFGLVLIIFGRMKKRDIKELEKKCVKVIGKIVNYEEDDEGYGRYIYEYVYNGRKFKSGFDNLSKKDKREKPNKKFGKEILLYCDKKDPMHIEKANDYIPLLSVLSGILVIIFALLFV